MTDQEQRRLIAQYIIDSCKNELRLVRLVKRIDKKEQGFLSSIFDLDDIEAELKETIERMQKYV